MKENNSLMRKGGSSGAASPCAACKLLRRRCAQDCVFAPYFPADEPKKFANVHKVFGASNVNKMLQELPVHQRGDAVSSMVYEANARVRDPVYGCVGAISSLQQQIDILQTQLAIAQAEVVHMRMRQAPPNSVSINNSTSINHHHHETSTTNPSTTHHHPYHNPKMINTPNNVKSMLALEMVVDQASVGASLWSC